MNVLATLYADLSGGALISGLATFAGLLEIGEWRPLDSWKTKTERNTISPMPKTPPLIHISLRCARGEERKPRSAVEEEGSMRG